MKQALTILYSRIVVETMLAIGVVALIIGRLRRRLRVSPEQRTHAPLLWLVNMTADARLHRRLRRLAARARAAERGSPRHRNRYGSAPSQRLASDLAAEVVNLDERLLDTRSADVETQGRIVKELRGEADRIEALIDRVATLIATEADDPSVTIARDPIGEIAARLDQLEARAASRADAVIEATGSTATPPSLSTSALDSPT